MQKTTLGYTRGQCLIWIETAWATVFTQVHCVGYWILVHSQISCMLFRWPDALKNINYEFFLCLAKSHKLTKKWLLRNDNLFISFPGVWLELVQNTISESSRMFASVHHKYTAKLLLQFIINKKVNHLTYAVSLTCHNTRHWIRLSLTFSDTLNHVELRKLVVTNLFAGNLGTHATKSMAPTCPNWEYSNFVSNTAVQCTRTFMNDRWHGTLGIAFLLSLKMLRKLRIYLQCSRMFYGSLP